MKSKIIILFLLVAIFSGCGTTSKKAAEQENSTSKYEASWESLAQHNEEPDWFQDAKLGIYFHW